MLMNMRNTLNGGTNDYRISNVLAKYDLETLKDLFPDYPSVESPIIPVGTPWSFTPIKINTPESIFPEKTKGNVAFNVPAAKPEVGSIGITHFG